MKFITYIIIMQDFRNVLLSRKRLKSIRLHNGLLPSQITNFVHIIQQKTIKFPLHKQLIHIIHIHPQQYIQTVLARKEFQPLNLERKKLYSSSFVIPVHPPRNMIPNQTY